ncbi:hypothetical protein GGI43DRAFT_401751 [Trichoderma evansii]
MKNAISVLSVFPLVLGLTAAQCSAEPPITCSFTMAPNAYTPTCPNITGFPFSFAASNSHRNKIYDRYYHNFSSKLHS